MRQARELDVAAIARPASTARGRSRRRSGRCAAASARSSAGARSQRARRHRSGRQRRAEQPDRRVGVVDRRSDRQGSASPLMALTLASRARLRPAACGTACSSTATSRPWSRRRATARHDREWRDRHPGRQASSASASAPNWPASAPRRSMPLGGAWVTPGLIDCHTHLVFGGNRADEHAMRRAGATYEEIAKAGGGIASTVAATRAASDERAARAAPAAPARADGGRLHHRRDQVRLRPRHRERDAAARRSPGRSARARRCGSSRPCSRSTRLPPSSATAATIMSARSIDKTDSRRSPRPGWRPASTPFARPSPSRPPRSSALFDAAARPRPAGQAPRRAIVATSSGAALAAALRGAVGRPSRTSRRGRASRRWPRRARSRCCCPAPSTRCRRRRSRRCDLLRDARRADRHRHRLQPGHLAACCRRRWR